MTDSHAALILEIDRLRQALLRISNLGPSATLEQVRAIVEEALKS